MEAKPDWVPEWAWVEYERFVRRQQRWMSVPSPHGGYVGEHMTDMARAIFLDKGCSTLWPALQRRQVRYLEQWEEKQKGLPDGVRYGSESVVEFLLFAVGAAMRGPHFHERTPASERKERGERIARLASELRGELTACAVEGWGLPPEFDRAIKQVAGATVAAFVGEEEEWLEAHEEPPANYDKTQLNLLLRAIRFAVLREDASPIRVPALEALEEAGMYWAKSSPALYRPNDPNAVRLYFIREMTAFFRTNLGGPLREATAALTRRLFECEIDAATVAKLAP